MKQDELKEEASVDLKFEQLLGRVEDIVGKMQDGGMSLEDMLHSYESGMGYLTEVEKRLKTAKAKLEELTPVHRDGPDEN